MRTISKNGQGPKIENNDSKWETGQNLEGFFSVLEKIDSSGVSAIITREEKKKTNERDQGNQS